MEPYRQLICERDPERFRTAFLEAVDRKQQIFLADPEWGKERWETALRAVHPHGILGDLPEGLERTDLENQPPEALLEMQPAIMIPTGGSTRGLRFAIHNWDSLSAAAHAFRDFFNVKSVNSCCILPLWHVSGLMQVVRAECTGGKVAFSDTASIHREDFPDIDPANSFISVVPLQLKRFLEKAGVAHWLSLFRGVILGGAAADEALLDSVRKAGIPLITSYGMTETAALAVALDSNTHGANISGAGKPLPGYKIEIRNESGSTVEAGQRGRVFVKSPSLFFGYYPENSYPREDGFLTDDEGYIDSNGSLHISRRLDRLINTGGEKVDPAEVERALMATSLIREVAVTGTPDPDWGQAVTAMFVPASPHVNASTLAVAAGMRLAPYQVPKKWLSVSNIPRNAAGKIDWSRFA